MKMSILDTGVKRVKNVSGFNIGLNSITDLSEIINSQRVDYKKQVIYLIDHYFYGDKNLLNKLQHQPGDLIEYVDSSQEPTTDAIDARLKKIISLGFSDPSAIVGIGGGTVLDTTKAISNILTNGGLASDYQGWDLLRRRGVFKVGVPTISGTGAEATRTCVMTNHRTGLKLGMNSDYTVFDHIILDPELTLTVPREQYFYTGMDAYIHCIESMAGSYRNAIGDAYSRETINLCRQVFFSDEMMSSSNREKLMVASYLGGCAIATSYVGVVHPFSAGLSVVLGLHHCVANCIVMRAMHSFYPKEWEEFFCMAKKQNIDIPKGLAQNLTDEQYEHLYASTIIHEKPLTNALGVNFRDILTKERVVEIFKEM